MKLKSSTEEIERLKNEVEAKNVSKIKFIVCLDQRRKLSNLNPEGKRSHSELGGDINSSIINCCSSFPVRN